MENEFQNQKDESSDSDSEEPQQNQESSGQAPEETLYMTENALSYEMMPVDYHSSIESVVVPTVPMQRKRKSTNYSMVDYEMTSDGNGGVTTTTVLMQDKRRKHPKFLNLTRDESFFAVQHIPILYAKIKKSDGKYKDPRGRCIICARNCPVRCKTCNFWICVDRSDGSSNCWSQIHDIHFYNPMAVTSDGVPVNRDTMNKDVTSTVSPTSTVTSEYLEGSEVVGGIIPLPVQGTSLVEDSSVLPPTYPLPDPVNP